MTTRLIVSRYAGKCSKCGESYAEGARVFWTKGRKGVIHEKCNSPAPTPKPSTPRARNADGEPHFTWTYSEMKAAFEKVISGKANEVFDYAANSDNRNLLDQWRSNQSFTGCSIADMRDWLVNGFHADAFADIGRQIEMRPRRRIKYSEEGELQYDLMRSGFDYPFLEWEKRETKPGMRVEIMSSFNGGTSASRVAEYHRWIAKVLYTLETEGYDLEIAIRYDGSRSNKSERIIRCRTVVKSENEASDYAQWSALFSPGGHRMLGFLTMTKACDANGLIADSSLGRGDNQQRTYDVEFDHETRTLWITNPFHAQNALFSEVEMDEKLRLALKGN